MTSVPALTAVPTAESTGASSSASTTTHPPNPPPVIRTPCTPGTRERPSTASSICFVDVSKSRLRLRWLAYISRPASRASPATSAAAKSRTRSFSLTTCRARDLIVRSAMRSALSRSARRSGPISRSAAAHCATRAGYSLPSSVREEISTTQTASDSGIRTGVTSSVWQSISSAWSLTPAADVSWSMIPHGTLVARCSARRQTAASVATSVSMPNARAAATSSAALDDSPPPIGTSVATRP